MNHEQIIAADTTTRYVMRRLSPAEEEAFEVHLIDCPECQQEVQAELDLRDGLRARATAPPPRRAVSRTGALIVGFLAAAAVLFLVLSATLAVRLRQTSSALQAERTSAAELERRARAADNSAAALAAQVAAEKRRASEAGRGSAVAIVFLAAVRGSPPADRGPERVTIAGGIASVVFSIELGQPAGSAQFTASMRDATGTEVWRGGPFAAYSQDAIAVSIDATLLRDGNYVLALERPTPGSRVTVERHSFRVTRQR